MFDSNVPTYEIDLEQLEERRWTEVIAREREVAGRLMREAGAEIERIPGLVRGAFSLLYRSLGGRYSGEIAAWAGALGVSVGTATVLNCAYELSHLPWSKVLGCTAGVRWVEGLGLVHVRTLDWPLASLGAATRLFRFHRGPRAFVSVGVPGYLGVLSGMLPLAYSATINWAPPCGWPTFDFGPAFLLREVLETCDTFDAALARLTETRLSTSAFFTLCGTEQGQACVIERTRRESDVRAMTGPVLVQANHHVAGKFLKNNAELLEGEEGGAEFTLEGSSGRSDLLAQRLFSAGSHCSLEDSAQALDVPSILNELTCQQMAFCPKSGAVRVWRRGEG
jgi:acid ceramidase